MSIDLGPQKLTDREILVGICVEMKHVREDIQALDAKMDDLPSRVRRLEDQARSNSGTSAKTLKVGTWLVVLFASLGALIKSFLP